jgi:hypothetical protein
MLHVLQINSFFLMLFSRSLPITIVEFGDVFLTVTAFGEFSPMLRKINYKEFSEALVRIAFLAFNSNPKTSVLSNEDKVKGLLLNIWRYTQELLGSHMQEYGTLHGGGFNTAKEELLRSVEVCTSMLCCDILAFCVYVRVLYVCMYVCMYVLIFTLYCLVFWCVTFSFL